MTEDYDAEGCQIEEAQKELARNGVTKQMYDLDRYAGCTVRELKAIVKAVIEHYSKKNQDGKEVNQA